MGFSIKATKGTQVFLEKYGIACEMVRKLGFGRPDLVDAIKTGEIDLIINTPSGEESQVDDAYIRKSAIECQVPNLTTPAGALAAAKGIAARLKGKPQVKALNEYYKLIR
jgi:carbamoyl-phosphate synthase large subunit